MAGSHATRPTRPRSVAAPSGLSRREPVSRQATRSVDEFDANAASLAVREQITPANSSDRRRPPLRNCHHRLIRQFLDPFETFPCSVPRYILFVFVHTYETALPDPVRSSDSFPEQSRHLPVMPESSPNFLPSSETLSVLSVIKHAVRPQASSGPGERRGRTAAPRGRRHRHPGGPSAVSKIRPRKVGPRVATPYIVVRLVDRR